MRVVRPYTEQFEPKTAKTIASLRERLDKIDRSARSYKVITAEIQGCLYSGLLLSALLNSTWLLELFIRDLVVALRLVTRFGGDMSQKHAVGRELEEDRDYKFNDLAKELAIIPVTTADLVRLGDFYEEFRIPLFHGLVRRFTSSKTSESWYEDMFADLAMSQFEMRIEEISLPKIDWIVDFMERYQPWLLRRNRH